MDKTALFLLALLLGFLAGWLIWRDRRPLALNRPGNLLLLVPALLAGPVFLLLLRLQPENIACDGPVWLMGLALFRFLLVLLFSAMDSLPLFNPQKDAISWPGLVAFFVLVSGLAGETAVLLANHGVWPMAPQLLALSPQSVFSAAMPKPAYIFLQSLSDQQPLSWLGLIWPLPKALQPLSALPAISPAQVLTGLGCFLTGLHHMRPRALKNKPSSG